MKQLRMTIDQARNAGFLPKNAEAADKHARVLAKGDIKRDKKTKRGQNSIEKKYDAYLKSLVQSGRIIKYEYESHTFKLADDLRYVADFYVLCNDGSIQFHDTKGRTKKDNGEETFYSRKGGIPKIKMAAEKFPEYRFFVVWMSSDKKWMWQEIG